MYDESKHTQAYGFAVATSGGGGGGPIATVSWLPEGSNTVFTNVPTGKRLIITDVMLYPQGDVKAVHTVNLAQKNPDGTHMIFFQFRVPPGAVVGAPRRRFFATQQAHFLTGHVIWAGKEVITFTDAKPPAGQHISVALNAYLAT
jgi:hypothetical protein